MCGTNYLDVFVAVLGKCEVYMFYCVGICYMPNTISCGKVVY